MTKKIYRTQKPTRLKVLTRLLLAVLVIACFSGTSSQAKVFVSFNGKFHITYPDDWQQADYRTVDYYLRQSDNAPDVLRYEAVFSPHESGHFADDVYLILTVDPVGELSESQIDSLLKRLGGVFGEGLKYFPVGDFMTDLKSNTPVYDPKTRTVSIVTEITEKQNILKKCFLVIKFYEYGIVNFYFYSPEELFEQSRELFTDIVASFSIENLEDALSKEDVKVADLETKQSRGQSRILWLLVVLAIVIIAFGVMRRRRKKAS